MTLAKFYLQSVQFENSFDRRRIRGASNGETQEKVFIFGVDFEDRKRSISIQRQKSPMAVNR